MCICSLKLTFSKRKSIFFHSIMSKQYKEASAEGSANVREAAGATKSDWQLLLCLAFLSWGSLLLLRSFQIWVPSDYVPTLDNGTFAIINTQPTNMKGEHWIMIANSRQKLCFADSLGRKKYISPSSNVNRSCQVHCSLTQVFETFIQYMQLFISSSFEKKKF